MFDVKKLKEILDFNVTEDIKEFGRPAIIYNYHYKNKQLNAIDDIKMWEQEQSNLKNSGMKITPVQKEVQINNDTWECTLWVCQFTKNNDKKTEIDPLAISIGYLVQAVCYLQFIKKKEEIKTENK